MTYRIPRRRFLRGIGTMMALPLLEAMSPLAALAQSGGKVRPNRMAFLFTPNGAHMPDWIPTTEGPQSELPYILEPLKNVKDYLTVLTGLTQNNARSLGDGGGDHARSAAVWLTGVHPRKTSGADIKVGLSVDQLAAQHVGDRTRFPSLEIGCERGAQAGNCDSGYSCAYSSTISWRTASTPVAKEVNPRLVFERLFGNGDQGEAAESRHRREVYQKSILDFVMEDASNLRLQLGSRDQRKLDEYFTGVRELEQRLTRVEKDGPIHGPTVREPAGVPPNYGDHIRLMSDMMVLAFQADLTRICSFMLANDGSNRSFKIIGIPEGHHDLSHHGGDKAKQEKIRQINHFQITQLAYLLEKMKSIEEGDGTLLDNSMIVYGAGISDGDRHNHDNLPILLAGRGAGTIKSGQHIRYPSETPMSNLFVSMLDRMGVPGETIGDSHGPLPQLF